MFRSSSSVLSVALLVFIASGQARGHGTAPEAHTAFIRPGNPEHLIVETTFGLIITTDGGKNWGWICDEALGGTGTHMAIHLTPDGHIWAGNFAGLFVSSDNGCTWQAAAELASGDVSDIVSPVSQPTTLYVTTSSRTVINRLRKSTDNGATFADTSLSDANSLLTSVRVAPSNRYRLYVGGWAFNPAFESHLFRSNDEGVTFEKRDLSSVLPSPGPFFVWAVHPTNPQILFASVNTTAAPFDKLVLRSEDGGNTFEVVMHSEELISQIALSADGSTVWVATKGGLFRSTDGGKTFSTLPAPHLNACVTRSGDALYVCGEPTQDGWALGKSTNGGDSFVTAMKLSKVSGPIACSSGSTVPLVCGALWHAQKAAFPTEAAAQDPEEPPTTPEAPEEELPPVYVNAPRTGASCSSLSGIAIPALLLWTGLLRRSRRRSTVPQCLPVRSRQPMHARSARSSALPSARRA